MAQEMEKLGGTSEEDEDEEELEMEVKEEEDDDVPSGPEMVIGAMGDAMNAGFFDDDQQRRAMVATAMHQQQGGTGSRRCRPKEEKERTKLRERHRRAITARILAGLRRHGNYNLRVRADINEVIAALAREAGWVVLPDGTTFPSRPGPGATAPSPQVLLSMLSLSLSRPFLSSCSVFPFLLVLDLNASNYFFFFLFCFSKRQIRVFLFWSLSAIIN